MSRNGSGVYSPPGASFPAVSGTLIESSKFNAIINDIASALTQSVSADGQTPITANLPMAGFKLTGLGNGVSASDSATIGQLQSAPTKFWCGTATGTANALTLTPALAAGSYVEGQIFTFKSSASPNTGATTVNVSGLGAIAVQNNGAALVGGEIKASVYYELLLSSTSLAQLSPVSFESLNTLGADIASAATVNLDAATGDTVAVTGTTTITAITLSAGRVKRVRHTGAQILTHGASLILPGAANITTADGDYSTWVGYAAGVVRCVAYDAVASAAEAQAYTNNAKSITPLRMKEALQGSNQSTATDGYQKLPGGLILQWGKATTVTAGSNTFNFPIAFPTAALNVSYSLQRAGVSLAESPCINSISTTNFNIEVLNTAYTFYWLAIGY